MILLIHGYGGNKGRQQRSVISSTIATMGEKVGNYDLRELNIAKVRIDTFIAATKPVKIAYISSEIPEQREVGDYLEGQGAKVIEYNISELHYKPERVPGNTKKTNVYLLKEKIESDKAQKFNQRKYKRVKFIIGSIQGYRVEIEDVREYDYDVKQNERYSSGKLRYARNKEEIREIIETYKQVQQGRARHNQNVIQSKEQEIKEIEQEIKELQRNKKAIELAYKENLQVMEETYKEGVR